MYNRKTIENNIILMALAGSRSYGMETDSSDYDWRGIMIRPYFSDYVRYEGFEQKDSGWLEEDGKLKFLSEDTVVWDLKKYLKLANKANPNILEVIFNPNHKIITPTGQKLIDNRFMFLNRNVIKTYKGYAYAQLKRLSNKTQNLCSEIDLPSPVKTSIRKVADENAGYPVKHAMHCLRLLYQLHYIYLKRDLVININGFSYKQELLLRKIKAGQIRLDYVQEECSRMMNILDELDFDVFPKPLPEQQLSDFFIEMIETYYANQSTRNY